MRVDSYIGASEAAARGLDSRLKYFGRTASRKADGLCTRMTSPGSSHPTDSHGASFSMSSNRRTGKFMRESEEKAVEEAKGRERA